MLGAWLSIAFAAPTHDAESARVLQDAATAHGLSRDVPLALSFEFRGTPYRLSLDSDDVRYERTVTTDAGPRTDRLVGSRFEALRGGESLPVEPKQADAWRRSLNSVAYFATLPRPLFDDAVIATSLGRTRFAGGTWDTVEVRFREEGGGDDHDDVFRYWFDPDTHELALLAYTFHTGKGGVRIRAVSKRHAIDGVVLIDWINYGVNGHDHTLQSAMTAYEDGTLPQLSTIALDGPTVKRPSSR